MALSICINYIVTVLAGTICWAHRRVARELKHNDTGVTSLWLSWFTQDKRIDKWVDFLSFGPLFNLTISTGIRNPAVETQWQFLYC